MGTLFLILLYVYGFAILAFSSYLFYRALVEMDKREREKEKKSKKD